MVSSHLTQVTYYVGLSGFDSSCLNWYIHYKQIKKPDGRKLTVANAISAMVTCFIEDQVIPMMAKSNNKDVRKIFFKYSDKMHLLEKPIGS